MNDSDNKTPSDSETPASENGEAVASTESSGTATSNAAMSGTDKKSAQESAIPVALTRKERAAIIAGVVDSQLRSNIPVFSAGDTVKVHAKIVEGNKERIQIFEGVVIERQGKNGAAATFTVRKISYNIGVERKFLVNSPRIDKIEVVSRGQVRRAKLYYLRGMRGKASRIKSRFDASIGASVKKGANNSKPTGETPEGSETENSSANSEGLQTQASA